jgi:hypothetical protein
VPWGGSCHEPAGKGRAPWLSVLLCLAEFWNDTNAATKYWNGVAFLEGWPPWCCVARTQGQWRAGWLQQSDGNTLVGASEAAAKLLVLDTSACR